MRKDYPLIAKSLLAFASVLLVSTNIPKVTMGIPPGPTPIPNPSSFGVSNTSNRIYDTNATYIKLAGILKDATPGQISKLSVIEYQPSVIAEALNNLSSSDLATVLAKLSVAKHLTILSNLSSSDLATVLAKLPTDDLAIAFNYHIPPTYHILISQLFSSDLGTVLDKLSPDDLATLLGSLSYHSLNYALSSISADRIENMINLVPANILATDFNSTASTLLTYVNMTSTQFKHPGDDITKILSGFSAQDLANHFSRLYGNAAKFLLTELPILKRANVLSILARSERPLPSTPPMLISPAAPGRSAETGAAAPTPAYDFMYIPIPSLLYGLLTQASPAEIPKIPLTQYSPTDLATALSNLTTADLGKVLKNIGVGQLTTLLNELPRDVRTNILNKLPTDVRTNILNKLPTDLRAAILNKRS